MSLRRARSHKEGISNIDFRSKQDIDNIRLFKPWQSPKEFGTMGYRNYKIPIKKFKNLFSPTNEINTQKDIVNEFPDPKYFTTAQFYKKNNILLKRKTFFNNDRVANLEESFKGKDIFNGDSMNIAEIMTLKKITKRINNKTGGKNQKIIFIKKLRVMRILEMILKYLKIMIQLTIKFQYFLKLIAK